MTRTNKKMPMKREMPKAKREKREKKVRKARKMTKMTKRQMKVKRRPKMRAKKRKMMCESDREKSYQH